MRTSIAFVAGTGVATLVTVAALAAPAAAAQPDDHADHGHILVLGVETIPGTNPPFPTAIRGCVDLAAGQAVPRSDQLHVDYDGGSFTERSGNIIIPTYPCKAPNGMTVPWRDCADFVAFFGLS